MYNANDPQPQPQPQSRQPRRWKLWVGLGVVLLILIFLVLHWALGTNKATISQTSTKKAAQAPSFKTYDGAYMKFQYPGTYNQISHSLQQSSEQSVYKADVTYQKNLTVAFAPLPSGGLGSDSNYFFRKQHTDLYDQRDVTVGGEIGTEFIKQDGSELTLFVAHGAGFASISVNVSLSNDTEGLATEMDGIVQSLEWR